MVAFLFCGWQADSIDIPACLITYRDLAKQLSVECAPSIRPRIAVVAFHQRKRSEVLTVLSDGLGITFETKPDGTVWMTPDPKVAEARKQEFSRYTSEVDRYARSVFFQAEDYLRQYGWPPREKALVTAETPKAQRGPLMVLGSAGLYYSTGYGPIFGEQGQLAVQDWKTQVQTRGGLRDLIQRKKSPNRSGCFFDPASGKVFFSYGKPGEIFQTPPDQHDIPVPYSRDPLRAPRAFPLPEDWTQSSLAQWATRQRIAPPLDDAANQLAQKQAYFGEERRSCAALLAQWATQTGQDVVMEVSPVRDRVELETPAKTTLASLLWPKTRSNIVLTNRFGAVWEGVPPWHQVGSDGDKYVDMYAPGIPAFPVQVERREMSNAVSAYTAAVHINTLVLKNRFAWLDEHFPTAAVLIPEGGAKPEDLQASFDLPHFQAFCKALKPDDESALATLDVPWANRGLIRAIPFMKALAAVKPETQKEHLANLERTGTTTILLGREARKAFLDSLTRHAEATDDVNRLRKGLRVLVQTPAFREGIPGEKLVLSWIIAQTGKPGLVMTIQGTPPAGALPEVVGVLVELQHGERG